MTIFPSQFFKLEISAISLSLPQWGTESYPVLQSGNIKQKQPLWSYFHDCSSVRQKQWICTVPDPCQWEHTFLPPPMATPSVFFGVSNYHSERWDRRQIFNRQAITGVNTVPLHLLQIQGTVTAHTGALLTQWNRLGTPSGGQTDCGPVFRIWTTWRYKTAIRHRPDLYEAFIANTGSLYHKHMPAHEIRLQKNPNNLTRTKSFPGVHLYLLPRLGICVAVFLVPLYFFMAMNKHNSTFSGMLISPRR